MAVAGNFPAFSAEYQPAAIDTRRSRRHAIVLDDADFLAGRGGLDRALCKVVDLSCHGARLQTYTMLRRGALVWLTLGRQPRVAACVRWVDGFTAGCEFLTPLTSKALKAILG